ncbi:MAG: metallophosphoesterase family protein [Myxococcota bacterium]
MSENSVGHRRRIAVILTLIFVVLVLLLRWWGFLVPSPAPMSTERPSHLRIVWTSNPSREASIVWSTAVGGSSELRIDAFAASSTSTPSAIDVACFRGQPYAAGDAFVHRCVLRALQPSTRYTISVSTDGRTSPPHWFVTAPTDDRSFRLLFGGDSRSDPVQRRLMNRRIAAMVAEDPGILALAHGGDYVANGRRWSHWQQWLDDWGDAIGPTGRILPIIPARGNHEGFGPLFGEIFAEPGAPDYYYLTRIGSFRLFTLNTETSLAGDQREWLAKGLEHESSARWRIAQYHRAAYPAVKMPSEALRYWVPLFEEHQVDLVFESDGHALKRTVPIRNAAYDPSGVVYLGEGGLGVMQRRPQRRWYLKKGGMAASAHHIHVLSVSADKLEFWAVGADGRELDRSSRPHRSMR